MLSDIVIAQAAKMLPIAKVAEKLGLTDEDLIPYGRYKAKINHKLIHSDRPDGKLILMTAISPTPAGEGKTTTSVGLADALNAMGKKTMLCLREPSLGPVFGVKGGAAGGGYAQVVPMEDINLHFTGDIHAIGTANNLLAAMIDNSIQQGNPLNIDPRRIAWKRCMDMNDRQLRFIVDGLGGKVNGTPREDGFDITVASEVMAVFCLATDLHPSAVVLVATVRALKSHGGVTKPDLNKPNAEAVRKGAANLERHIDNIKNGFGLPVCVAINAFPTDTPEEMAVIEEVCAKAGVKCALSEVFAKGGEGGKALAETVLSIMPEAPQPIQYTYDLGASLPEKIEAVAKKIYRADGVTYTPAAKKMLDDLAAMGYGELPVCIAKTQYSFSDNAKLTGAPTGFKMNVREVRLSAGAGFVVVICGSIMTMPGLPKHPAAMDIDVDAEGRITGLF